ncbi:MAG: outer membrane protein beta-barrel domain [Bacteroidota bacterium]|jgi:hypothetical protein
MKSINLVCFTILFFISSNSIFGQHKIYGGFKLTSNYSVFTEKVQEWKSRLGYGFGYFEVMELDYPVNLQAEINFTTNTFINKTSFGTQSVKITNNYHSFEIPLLAKYRINDHFSFGIGYQFSIGSSGKSKTVLDNNGNQSKSSTNLTGINTSGFLFDANHSSEKTMFGFRIIRTNDNFIDPFKSINASVFFGFKLF